MLPPSSVTRNPSKQKRSASCAELWIIGRSDTTTQRRNDATTQRRCALAVIGYLESWELATASPSDGGHGAGSWPDYKTTDHWTTGEQSADRVKASLTRRCQRSEVGKRNDGEARVIGYCCRNGKYHRNFSHGGLNSSMIEGGRFGPTDEGQP